MFRPHRFTIWINSNPPHRCLMVLVCWTATFADLVIILIIVIYHLSHLPSFISITMLFSLVYSVIMSRVLCYQSLAIILVKVKYLMPGFQLLLAHSMIIEAMSAKYYCYLRSSLQWRLKIVQKRYIMTSRPLWYERVYLPLHKVADTPFHIQKMTVL